MRKYINACCRYIPKPRLTPSWKKLHRTYTVNLSVLLAILSVAQEHWPQFQSFIPAKHFASVSLILAVLITVLRYIDQPKLQTDGERNDQK